MCQKQEKYENAREYFEKAIAVNPHSATLHGYLAVMLHSMGKNELALKSFARAMEIDPKNKLNLYQKSQVLRSTGQD